MSADPLAAAVGAGICVVLAPYLARLTLTVPDRDDRRWWRGAAPSRRRLRLTTLVAVLLGALAAKAAGWGSGFPATVALAAISTPLVLIDFEHHRLPDRLVVPAAAAAAGLLAVAAHDDWTAYLRAIEGAAAVFAVLFVIWFLAPRAFGFGDVKLGGVLGAYLGFAGWSYAFYGILAGFVLGSVVGIALLATGKGSLKTALAFGPMLVLGTLLVLAFDLVPAHHGLG